MVVDKHIVCRQFLVGFFSVRKQLKKEGEVERKVLWFFILSVWYFFVKVIVVCC